jgi:hypothetical protein
MPGARLARRPTPPITQPDKELTRPEVSTRINSARRHPHRQNRASCPPGRAARASRALGPEAVRNGARPRCAGPASGDGGGPFTSLLVDGLRVDLVEVAVAVVGSAATRPLPHQRIGTGAAHPAEPLSARRGAAQGPACGMVAKAAGIAAVGPLVDTTEVGSTAGAEDIRPDRWRGINAGLAGGMVGEVVGEPAEVGYRRSPLHTLP